MDKLSDDQRIVFEYEKKIPRETLLENVLSAEVLDERFLKQKTPGWRRWLYNYISANFAQVLEASIIHRRYDVILSHSEKAGLPLAMIMKLFRMKTPHVMIISRITSVDDKRTKQKMWFLKQTHKNISRILMWSSVQRKIAVEKLDIPPEKVVHLKKGTDQKFWSSQGSTSTDMICSVGMEARDYPTLVEALRPLDIPCHIATGAARGELFNTVKKLYDIKDLPAHITVGGKSTEELRALYARCRFVVVPLLETDSDNGLTTILEAMAMGKPVICSKVEGQVDIIKDGKTGILVPQGNPEKMREAILELWNDPERVAKMGQQGRKYIEKYHKLDQFVYAIKKEVSEALNEYHTYQSFPLRGTELKT